MLPDIATNGPKVPKRINGQADRQLNTIALLSTVYPTLESAHI